MPLSNLLCLHGALSLIAPRLTLRTTIIVISQVPYISLVSCVLIPSRLCLLSLPSAQYC